MALSVIQTSFAQGEIAPALYGHVDITKFRSAGTTVRNMYVGYRGGVYSRAGTAFVGQSKQNPVTNEAVPPRLVSFEFSITQSTVLEFGNFYIRFISQGGYVVEAAVSITGATQANPCQITAPAHGFANGNWVALNSLGGMTQLNGNTYIVAGATANTFTLQNLDGVDVVATGYSAYTTGGTAARIYEISSPYAGTDVTAIKFTQSADVISLVHPSYPPYDLSRLASTVWTLTPTSFGAAILPPASVSATATVHPSGASSPPTLPCAFAYEVTAIDPKTGQESIASPIANVLDSVDIAATAGSIKIVWAAVVGAQSYNVYKAPASYNTDPGNTSSALPVPVGSIFGFMGSSFGNEFDDSNITPNPSTSPPQHRNPFAPGQIVSVVMGASSGWGASATVSITSATGSGFVGACVLSGGAIVAVIVLNPGQGYVSTDTPVFAGGGSASATLNVGPQTGTYPSVVAYYQQRRFYAASLNRPDTYWASQPGAFTNFDSAIPVNDSDSLTGTPWSEQVDGIQWMVSMPLGLVTFTGNAVWQVGATGGGFGAVAAITPSNQVAVPQSSIGASSLVPPIRINWDILYLDSHNSTVRDLTYQLYFNVYTGLDISWQSSHLLENHTIVAWAWAEVPNRILWMVRDDGILLSLTYLKEQEIAGWARHDTQGQVKSICAVTELPVDAVYMVVERSVAAGGVRYFIERMDNRQWQGVEDSWCVDAGLTIPLTTYNTPLGASAGSGNGVTFFCGAPGVFVVGDVGKVIRMGGGIALITGYTSAIVVTGNWIFPCQQIIPNDPLNLPIQQNPGAWSIGAQVTTVSGLNHLIGKTVTGVADGIVIAPTVVSAAGTITLVRAASLVTVGLGFTAQLQSVYLDTGQPTIQGRRKAISAATVRIEASSSLQLGANQADAAASNPVPTFKTWALPPAVVSSNAPATYTTPSGGTVQPLFTGDLRALVPPSWQKPGQVAVQQSQPLPLAVLDLVPELLPGDTAEVEMAPRQQPRGQRPRAAA